jgi:hypothetical protein
MNKSWFLSKTIWVNVLTTTGATLGYVTGVSDFLTNNPGFVVALLASQGIVNVLLRLMTCAPIK